MARATCGIYEALWLARLHHASARALYLHIPFCVRKCAYCDFSSWATARHDPLLGAYASALSRLMWQAHDAGLLQGLETTYIGGGTPTMLGDELAALAWLERVTGRMGEDEEREWWDIGGDQFGIFATRYSIAFAGYAALSQ